MLLGLLDVGYLDIAEATIVMKMDGKNHVPSCSVLYFYSAVCENETGCFSFVFVDPVLTWDRPVFVPFSSRFPSLCDYYMFLIMLIHY